MRQAILQALEDKYNAQISEADATIKIYLDHSVGIGEHPQHIEEIDKQLQKIVDAAEKLKELQAFIPKILLELSLRPLLMLVRRLQKLKRYLNRLQEKSKS